MPVLGSGLGKNENGRADPVKASLKMDKTGVGHDPGKEFTDHWWLRVFNEAAQQIGKKKQTEVSEDQKKADAKSKLYKGFVKSSTLTNGVELSAKDSESSEEESDVNTDTRLPTLDDIHKFCGGATGHRAAMFGIKMKGKLSRVAEQDLHFEENINKNKSDDTSIVHTETESNCQEIKRKKKKKHSSNEADCIESQEEVVKKKKKSKDKEIEECISNVEVISERSVKKKKKKHKEDSILLEETNSMDCTSRKKKKHKEDSILLEETNSEDCTSRKKKKHKEDSILLEETNSEDCTSRKKKKKRKMEV